MLNLNNLSAYELVKEESLSDISSTGYLLRHKKSGARVAIISNEDDNKVFSISFRTTPDDETGVPHIIEHTVLCGSEKYPLKDPFVDLTKGSLNTFLNAMTYPDKTMYPIASYNMQDYKNLMDVYMDAVFSPMMLKEEKIFKQEGWHYEMEDENSDLTINGVVYNEMKGAYSSEDDILMKEITKSLFPDNTYSNNSGGNPEKIPELTYEKYKEFYKTYYHPSNAYIYLYGDVDVLERLDYLDKEYLCKFDAMEMHTEVIPQKAFEKQVYIEKDYPIPTDGQMENSTYYAYNWVVGSGLDKRNSMAMDILDYALISAPGAPLMKALLDAGIGEDVFSVLETGSCQSCFSVIAKGANEADKERFVQIIEDTLKEQVKNGINKNSLLAAINIFEFKFREADYGRFPKGLMYCIECMDSWLFDDEKPFLNLKCLDEFSELRKLIDTDYFEKLIETNLLNNSHSSLLKLSPNPGKNLRQENALKEELAALKASMSSEDIANIVRQTKELHEYQEAPSDEAVKDCLPMLKRSDLRKETLPILNEEENISGVKVVRHDYETNGIDYVSFYYDVEDIEPSKVSLFGLFTSLVSYMVTENYSYLELSNAINIYTGGLSSTSTIYIDVNDSSKNHMKYIVRIKVLEENFAKALELVEEVIFRTDFTDVKRLTEAVLQVKSRLQSELASSGHVTALTRAMGNFSVYSRRMDELHGIAFYQFICQTEQKLKEDPEVIIKELQDLYNTVFSKERLTVGFTANNKVYKSAVPMLKKHIEKLPDHTKSLAGGLPLFENRKEAFTDASQIQYVAQAGDFSKYGFEYNGCLRILKHILNYEYLWINIRVKGGAYGCMNGFARNGETYYVSYRDPNLSKTLEVYKGIPEFVRTFHPDEREMTGYVIGTFSIMDTPMNPEAKGQRSMNAYFTGITFELLQKERTEILTATVEDIQALAPLVEASLKDQHLCVIGNENKIQEEKEIFTSIAKLNE